MLGPADFEYLGSYPVANQNGLTLGSGLALRYVQGQLRFLTTAYDTGQPAVLDEFALPDGSDGAGTSGNDMAAIDSLTNQWDDIWSPHAGPNVGSGDHFSLYWEELSPAGRLWTTRAVDYPSDPESVLTQAISVRALNDDGTISDPLGEYGFAGVGQRAIYGGIQRLPTSFLTATGLSQPYVVGWGGYSSRMAAGLVPSMGLMAMAIPDVTGYAPDVAGVEIPEADFRILADHRSGTTNWEDWYASWEEGYSPPFDRGIRQTPVINYFDGGDDRPNGTTADPPAGDPLPDARWLSPGPDGQNRFVWGDSYHATGNWIEGVSKHGLVVVLTALAGKAWYCNSTLCSTELGAEIQVFDPDDLAAVLTGDKAPWNVQPVAMRSIIDDPGPVAGGRVAGAAFDARTRILWLWWPSIDGGYGSRLLAYLVHDG